MWMTQETNNDNNTKAVKKTRGRGQYHKYPTYCFPCNVVLKNKFALYRHKSSCENKDKEYYMNGDDLLKLARLQFSLIPKIK